mmetsp:Transcript_24071/g.46847  ORF Transcript_24071/g.46847 Transcript_24071/m.46847 type:complete len:443 (+) Transcript_24071:115-1443(+)|eukprot:CAMPEP_0172733564 /NCGR_PEP_ID=MMETSP1074-20121228/107490_1 /TAXON_ID=2916 /ORGANISM="Ceratium fusus, Strain PA161109" /LENGTH=442 /DNA_ID=CAMNT_0013562151 /DNA_START=42 /DNA_END=1370 /DNA_ORIENTATION=+
MPGGPYVEVTRVQRNKGTATWYNALILDIHGSDICIEFEDDIWPSTQVPASTVRRPPPSRGEVWQPVVGEPVEVLVAATEASPSGWCLGHLKKIANDSFYFVALEGVPRGQADKIVQRDGLRNVSTEPPIDVGSLIRRKIPVHRDLHTWIRSQDCLGCLSDVQTRGRLLGASCIDGGDSDVPYVLLVGDQHAVTLGEKLLTEIHFKHQVKMQRFQLHREKLMEMIAHHESHHQARHSETISVESSFVGRIIGKKGENIKRLQEEHSVNISIKDPDDYSKDSMTTIVIYGTSIEQVRKAREEIEYVVVRIPIEQEQVGWIVGKQYKRLADIAKKAELHYARFNDKECAIELCGLRYQIEDAKMLISVQRDYLEVHQGMSEEHRAIQQEFEALDELDGKGGKKGGKGAPKGAPRQANATGGKSNEGRGKQKDGFAAVGKGRGRG